MTIPQVTKRTNKTKRNAFTLVELMIVIVIIGILLGISAPFIFAAMRTAKEFTITYEIVQLDAAIQRFETKHGFFPPSIGPGLEIDTAGDPRVELVEFRRYLNRIAPNHAEGTFDSGGGLEIWWEQVGSNLDGESSLVFWLSGLCTSKQYPLSGNASNENSDVVLAPYNVNKDAADNDLASGVNIDRNVFFDFDIGRIVPNGSASTAGIKSYIQPFGKEIAGSLLAYEYRDFRSYGTETAYHIDDPDSTATPPEAIFFNADSFQIICPGMDGVVAIGNVRNVTSETNVNSSQDDNITNFSDGRLERSYGG